jgi:hypothetical protein
MLGLQEAHDIPIEAPVGEGASMCTILVEDEAGVWDAIRGLSELLGRVEAGTAPTDDEGRCGDLTDPIPMSKASGFDRRIMTEGCRPGPVEAPA